MCIFRTRFTFIIGMFTRTRYVRKSNLPVDPPTSISCLLPVATLVFTKSRAAHFDYLVLAFPIYYHILHFF